MARKLPIGVLLLAALGAVGCAVNPSGVPAQDVPDTGPGEVDAGSVEDASAPEEDAGEDRDDAFVPDEDAFVPDEDAFVPDEDGGGDAFVPDPDGGGDAFVPECVLDSDCTDPPPPDFGPCLFPADICAQEGRQERTRTRVLCTDGECVPGPAVETRSCTRDTDGRACDLTNPCAAACEGGACVPGAADGQRCDDGLSCTSNDRCSGGVCGGRDDCGRGQDRCSTRCGRRSACVCQEAGPVDSCGCR